MMTNTSHLEAVLRCVSEIITARESTRQAKRERAPVMHIMGGAIGEADWIAELYNLTHEAA